MVGGFIYWRDAREKIKDERITGTFNDLNFHFDACRIQLTTFLAS